jgi:hypothetical protein
LWKEPQRIRHRRRQPQDRRGGGGRGFWKRRKESQFSLVKVAARRKPDLTEAAAGKRPAIEIVAGKAHHEIDAKAEARHDEIGQLQRCAKRNDRNLDCKRDHEHDPHAFDDEPQERNDKSRPVEAFAHKSDLISSPADQRRLGNLAMNGPQRHRL